MLPKFLKSLFALTFYERKGILFLWGLLILLIGYYWVDDYLIPKNNDASIELTELESIDYLQKEIRQTKEKLTQAKTILFQFNPNQLDEKGWEKLGFTRKQVRSILKYIDAGGHFYKPEDLLKLYVIDQQKYEQLQPFIILPERKQSKKHKKNCYRIVLIQSSAPVYDAFDMIKAVYYKKRENNYLYYSRSFTSSGQAETELERVKSLGFESAFIEKLPCDEHFYKITPKKKTKTFRPKLRPVVELNSADTSLLKTLTGIGSYYAKKIVDYRMRLGGFYSFEQLTEIYKLEHDVIDANRSVLSVDTTLIQKININTADKEQLKKHPYIKWQVANSIVLYRANHGKYKQLKDITQSVLVSDSLYKRLRPYLKK